MAELGAALANLSSAHGRLVEFAALPVTHDRDKAGVIQAFEFTFELFWKTFQKLAPEAGLRADSPRQALQAGASMGFIALEQEPIWGRMLADRNLTSHVYREEVANEVFGHITSDYISCFTEALRRLVQAAE